MEQWIIGNWKMNASAGAAGEFCAELRSGLPPDLEQRGVRAAVCPPFPYLETVGALLTGTQALLGAQNVHAQSSGAFTGEVSAPMLADLGVALCLAGHSERRAQFHETGEQIRDKLRALLGAAMRPVLCVGETLAEREAGRELEVVRGQLEAALRDLPKSAPERLLVAYEPVWAIGTGRTATPEQAQAMHRAIREWLDGTWSGQAPSVPILYGGSVTPQNAAELLKQPDIGGALVGGASLKAESFLAIIQCAGKK